MHRGILYRTDGTQVGVVPANRRNFTLEELQGYVGGYIETVQLTHGTMYCNEEGLFNGLPFNRLATNHANKDKWWRGQAYLVGDVIFYVGDGKTRED